MSAISMKPTISKSEKAYKRKICLKKKMKNLKKIRNTKHIKASLHRGGLLSKTDIDVTLSVKEVLKVYLNKNSVEDRLFESPDRQDEVRN